MVSKAGSGRSGRSNQMWESAQTKSLPHGMAATIEFQGYWEGWGKAKKKPR